MAAYGFGFGKAASKPEIGTYPIEPEIRTCVYRKLDSAIMVVKAAENRS